MTDNMTQAEMIASPARDKGTLVLRVSDAIRNDILQGSYAMGDKLPSEAQLTRAFGVSRTVIREAIAALRSDGLVEARQGAGVFVLDPINFTFQRNRMNVDKDRVFSSLEVLEARTPLEIEAAGLAALRRSPAQEEEIFEKHAALIGCANDGQHWSEADIALHIAIAKATNNPLFATFLEMQGNAAIPQTGQEKQLQDEDEVAYRNLLIKEHERIVMAISNRDETEAREAMRDHLKGSQERHRSLLRNERMRVVAKLRGDS
ncbi:DNA-binding transcriptional regulator, FadR family [Cohaesibacter sp. ES.047]|uniref:FadR/GntR family transcriptional regulator n=1 Tax=Cohaesibacter sp. ES.047 TaxID=1798205 RepID=UPI000BC045DC|nr:FadR/GntR family transcriptional regulator [Cohaesibacter sp. ES.047]SNY90225.1 DNA-binding transcriptional regulator, FadR family [Cohaesibacter sp. ES.047]